MQHHPASNQHLERSLMLALQYDSQGIGEHAEVLSAALKCNVSAPHRVRCLVMMQDV